MVINNRSLFKPKAKGTYRIENKADETTVYLYDEISYWGVSADQFVKDLNDIKTSTVHIRINSPGGSVFDGGLAIYNTIKQHKSNIITHVDGLAASIASVIALAGHEVRMSEASFLMIHEPWSMVVGGADELRKAADLIDQVSGTIGQIYSDKSGKPINEIADLMAAETWFTAQDALDGGFIDSIENTKSDKATNLFDLSIFANVPDSLKEQGPKTARDIEHILRTGGCCAKLAKAVVSGGFKEGDLRDVEPEIEPIQAEADGNQRDVGSSDQREVEKPSQETIDQDLVLHTQLRAAAS